MIVFLSSKAPTDTFFFVFICLCLRCSVNQALDVRLVASGIGKNRAQLVKAEALKRD